MKVAYSNKRRGFQDLVLDPVKGNAGSALTIRESSAIGDYEDSFDIPGSSFLYIGAASNEEAYNREEVAALIAVFQWWLDNGRLPDAEQLPGLHEEIEVTA